MSDVFREALEAAPPEDGPFRTAEPTPELRLQKAREASWARVAERTAEDIAREDMSVVRRQRWAWAAVVLSAGAALGIVGLALTLGSSWVALSCPAITAVLATAIVALRLGRK